MSYCSGCSTLPKDQKRHSRSEPNNFIQAESDSRVGSFQALGY